MAPDLPAIHHVQSFDAFSLMDQNTNKLGILAEGAKGAVTGTKVFRVTHMLYANDLSFTTNRTDQMQCMLDRLRGHAARKGLTIWGGPARQYRLLKKEMEKLCRQRKHSLHQSRKRKAEKTLPTSIKEKETHRLKES
eukprot:1160736-Pelagomonas_calceolata.AAC.15